MGAQGSAETTLEIVLILMTILFIFVTLRSQGVVELVFNVVYLFLTLIYYLLRLMPDS